MQNKIYNNNSAEPVLLFLRDFRDRSVQAIF